MALGRRLLVVLAVVGAGLVPVPATAAGYCSGSGVSVVVDFGALGGGIQKGCDATGNRNAARAFENTGHHLTYASSQPGFVCRVDAVPQSDPCVNTSPSDAYWGLYWSDGSTGWKYSSLGAGSLDVPAGATVAFSWQNGGTADPPGTAPASRANAASPTASPTPTRQPTRHATTKPSHQPASASTTAAGVAGSTATPSAATRAATASASAVATSGSPSPSTAASPGAAAVDEPQTTAVDPAVADQGADGLPWWVPVLVLLVVVGGGAAAWWTRRRGTT